jgi:hypothetical protein
LRFGDLRLGPIRGPDVAGPFTQDQAKFTAWRRIDGQIESEIEMSEPYEDIATKLDSIRYRTSPRGDWNLRARITEARQLLKLYQRSGSQALHDTVQEHLRQPAIQVYR